MVMRSIYTNKSTATRGPDLASTQEILRKRIKRLLRQDRGDDDPNPLSSEIIPFLTSLGSVVLIGGAIRDLARAGRQGFTSDLDFVVYGGDRDMFATKLQSRGGAKNKFGGYGLRFSHWKVDVWHLEDTWAKTAGLVAVEKPKDLLRCTFFDWDSVLYDLNSAKLIMPEDYLLRLKLRVMDICLEENPNPAGSLVRALRRAALWRVNFGPRLTQFSKKCLEDISWDELVTIDSRAFSTPVLKHLDRSRIIDFLNVPLPSPAGQVTCPVPNWELQLKFPFRGRGE